MKHGKGKKGKNVGGKRPNKTKNKKANKSTASINRKGGSKKANTKRNVYAGRNKRGGKVGINKLSAKERQIYRDFEALLIADERKLKATVTKKRGDKLFVIKLNQKGFERKIAALQQANFSSIDKFLKAQKVEPLYAFVTLKIKKPDEKGYYFNGVKSSADMVVNAENTKVFCVEVLRNYVDRMDDIIAEYYDEPTKVYNVVEMSIRFLFRS